MYVSLYSVKIVFAATHKAHATFVQFASFERVSEELSRQVLFALQVTVVLVVSNPPEVGRAAEDICHKCVIPEVFEKCKVFEVYIRVSGHSALSIFKLHTRKQTRRQYKHASTSAASVLPLCTGTHYK